LVFSETEKGIRESDIDVAMLGVLLGVRFTF